MFLPFAPLAYSLPPILHLYSPPLQSIYTYPPYYQRFRSFHFCCRVETLNLCWVEISKNRGKVNISLLLFWELNCGICNGTKVEIQSSVNLNTTWSICYCYFVFSKQHVLKPANAKKLCYQVGLSFSIESKAKLGGHSWGGEHHPSILF